MNEYDSQKMAELLDSTHGFELAEEAEDADVILLNTCSIREKAQEKVFHQLGRWKKLKDHKPDLVIGVGGCVASQEGDAIRRRAPFVDMVFGPQTLHRLPEMLNQLQHSSSPIVDVSFPEIEKFDHSRSAWEKNWKILDLTADSAHYAFYCIEVHKNTITITDWYIIVKFYAISYKTMLGSDLEYGYSD